MAETILETPPAADPAPAVNPAPVTDPAPAADPKPVANAPAADPKPAAAPDDWASIRTRVAGDDEKTLKLLSRYGTLDEAIKAGIEASRKLSQTRSEAKPGKDATPEEIAAYRAANGVPESPDKYEINLPNGIVVGEADKPLMDSFLEVAHKHHLAPDVVNAIAATQLELREKEVQARAEQDAKSLEDAQKELTSPEVWGSEAKLNINMIHGLLDTAPKGVKEQLLGARMADGTPLGNNVGALKWLATIARERNPLATVVPGSGSNAQQAVEAEIEKFRKMMANPKSDYWKGPSAEKNQARYRDLITAQMNLTKNKG